ncbi:MAG: transcriptional repressor [Candidatus Sabulitectum sp.]|nr:transcriptional repressor [Candidatus Sabulitectum sp.]
MEKPRRGSKQKRAVLSAAVSLANHPTAQQIFFKAREEVMSISFSTVYRNLGILVDEGDLITIIGAGSEVHYDHITGNHCHIQCSICGKVRDLDVPVVDFNGILPSEASGFTVDGVCVTFTGMCRDCREKTDSKGERR